MSLITPETDPDHRVVGHVFACHDFDEKDWPAAYWYCDSYDPKMGYWLTRTDKPDHRKNVSERAIGASIHELFVYEGRFICRWLREPVDVAKLGKYASEVRSF